MSAVRWILLYDLWLFLHKKTYTKVMVLVGMGWLAYIFFATCIKFLTFVSSVVNNKLHWKNYERK